MIKNDEVCSECIIHHSEARTSVPCDKGCCDYEEKEEQKSKSGRKHIKDSTELSGGHLW